MTRRDAPQEHGVTAPSRELFVPRKKLRTHLVETVPKAESIPRSRPTFRFRKSFGRARRQRSARNAREEFGPVGARNRISARCDKKRALLVLR